MVTITCNISEKLNAELEAMACRRGVSKSTVVRQALEKHLKRSKKKTPVLAFDLVRSLSGSLHGPANLSSHLRHMKGFGG